MRLRLSRREALRLAFLTYALALSFVPLAQPVYSWSWLFPDGTFVYEAPTYGLFVNNRGTARARPLVFVHDLLCTVPVVELSDGTSAVGGVSLDSMLRRIRADGSKVRVLYENGNLVAVKEIIPLRRGVQVRVKTSGGGGGLILSLWSWYFASVNGELLEPLNEPVVLEPTNELDLSVTWRGVETRVLVKLKPAPSSIVLYADERGVNRIDLAFNSQSVEMTIMPSPLLTCWHRRVLVPIAAALAVVCYVLLTRRTVRVRVSKLPRSVAKVLIAAGLLARLAVAPFTMHVWDVTTMQDALYQFTSGGSPYRELRERVEELRRATGLPLFYEGFTYLPHPLFFFAPTYLLYRALGFDPKPIVNGHAFNLRALELKYPDVYVFLLLYKLPIIAFDAVTILVLYGISPSLAALYAVHPYCILISSVWGHFDPIVGALILLSLVALRKKRSVAAGLLYGLSLLKPYAVVLAPAYLASLKGRDLLAFVVGAALALTPFACYALANLEDLAFALSYHASRKMGGVNMFSSVYFLNSYPLAVEFSKVAGALFWAAYAALALWIFKRRISFEKSAPLLLAAYLAFSPLNNEQYLAAALPLLAYTGMTPTLLPVIPLIYAYFNSPGYYYFLVPIFWSSPSLRSTWGALWEAWFRVLGPVQRYALYLCGLAMSLALLSLLDELLSKAGGEEPH